MEILDFDFQSRESCILSIYIGVAAHKPYDIVNDIGYQPVQVGAALHEKIEGFDSDSKGDNISELNPYFSELTALYYIWKNVDADYKGIVHYRRYFGRKSFHNRFKSASFDEIISSNEVQGILQKSDAILPKCRNYYIESNKSHYAHAHNVDDLVTIRKIIESDYPRYLPSFDAVMNRTKAHMFNMFVMKRTYFDEYSEWLFDILFKAQQMIDIKNYSIQEARVFGFLSELLLDVWLGVHPLNTTELPVLYLENEHIIKKMAGFLARKLTGSGQSHIKSSVDD